MRLGWLDMVRGAAAMLVMLGHVRSLLFVDFYSVPAPTVVDKLFYFLTSLGHDAVVVFFVLSGYFVGGSVASRLGAGQWSWRDYSIQRIVRLWTVLVPGLILTAALDGIGLYNGPTTYYLPGAIPSQNAIVDQQLGIGVLLGNLLFLQTIWVPTYGSNGPLWSLANEFWYYLLFPLIALTVWQRSDMRVRLVCSIAALVILVWLPLNVLAAFGIWLLGYVLYRITNSAKGRLVRTPGILLLGGSLFLLTWLALRRTILPSSSELTDIAADYVTAILVVILILGMMGFGERSRSALGGHVTRVLADSSYTLYVFHYPFCLLVVSTFLCCQRLQPNGWSYALFASLALGTWMYCFSMYLAFEARTDAIRAYVKRWFVRHRGGSGSQKGNRRN